MPLTPDRGLVRLFRGAVVGIVAMTLAAGLHDVAHGCVGPVGNLVGLLPVAVLVGVTLANRQYTFWRAWAVLLALQPAMHLASMSADHQVPDAAPAASNEITGRMLIAHVVAAAVAAAWLAIGDRVLWRWIGSVWRRLRADFALVAVRPGTTRSIPTPSTASTRARLLLVSAPRRGPPAGPGRLALAR